MLAYSVDSDSVYAVPSEIEDAGKAAVLLCEALADCTAKEQEALATRLSQRARVRLSCAGWCRRRRPAGLRICSSMASGSSRKTAGSIRTRRWRRSCWDSSGSTTKGWPASRRRTTARSAARRDRLLVQIDARRRAFSRLERPPTAGASVELTIDEYLQHVAERELHDGVAPQQGGRRHGHHHGSEDRRDSGDGERADVQSERLRGAATIRAAQPRGAGHLRAWLDVQGGDRVAPRCRNTSSASTISSTPAAGMIRFGSRVIHDTHDYGMLSFTDVIVKSSNVGAIRVGLRVGPERLGAVCAPFRIRPRALPGFSRRGEPASLGSRQSSTSSALASMSMGYQVGVTALQMVTAVSSVANGGELIQPRVVRALIRDGKRIRSEADVLGRSITPDTAATLTGIMEQVVERGTATFAKIDGYTIAGKTGTAAQARQRPVLAQRLLRVVCRVPAVAQSRSSPSSSCSIRRTRAATTGGPIAGPMFQKIAQATLRHFGIAPDLNAPPPVLVARASDEPVSTGAQQRTWPRSFPRAFRGRTRDLPDLRGLSAREALRVLTRIGLAGAR